MNINVDSHSARPALDLDELMEKIRTEVAERKQLHSAAVPSEPARIPGEDFAARRWHARELLALPATDFARAVHLAFFDREPSPDEFVRLRDRLLAEHVGRMRILREFRRSARAHGTKPPVEGLTQQFIWDRFYWSPPAKFGRFVGRGARNIWFLRRNILEFIARVETLERRIGEARSAQKTDRENAVKNVRQLHDSIETNRKAVVARIDDMGRRLADRLGAFATNLADADSRLAQAELKLVDHWRGIAEHKRGLEELASALQSESASGAAPLVQVVARQASHLLDPLYLSFEDSYRGTRADILERQRIYIPRVEGAYGATGHAPVVDLGCGRGEWLELLAEAGISARGFDLNRIAVEESLGRGLQVELAAALDALVSLPSESCSVITAFHVIEHLPFDSIVRLMDESLRVLRPGGLLMVETPNPSNLLVAAERFYLDPTHRNPLPSELIAYLLRSRGYDDVEVLPLHPVKTEQKEYSDPMLLLLQEKLYGPQDYGAIGRKSA